MLNVLTEKEIETAIRPAGSDAEFKRMRVWLEDRIAKGKKSPLSEIVTLTPVLATLLIERNEDNRPISKRNKFELRSDVAGGRYVFNGQSIIVSAQGTLNDGQHRCQTVIETGIPIETVIVFGPEKETRYTVDTGISKTVSNFLAMKGRKYSKILGAATGYIIIWKQHYCIPQHQEARPSKQAILEAADARVER